MSTAFIVVDLSYGDAGKGTTADFLVREKNAGLVVRFNGGAQAGHNVVTEDGRSHTFAQFGAGSFVPGVRTHLAEPVVVHPSALIVEANHLERNSFVPQPLSRLTIAETARIITPFHQAANRIRELARKHERHGTCGVGVGETVRDALENPEDVIRARDLRGRLRLFRQLEETRERLWASLKNEIDELGADHPEFSVFSDPDLPAHWMEFIRPMVANVVPDDWLTTWFRTESSDVVFEGAQGVLLDENYGFHPHTTWSDCTFGGALSLLKAHGFSGKTTRLGVLRTYLTRHGEGPFPTEDPALAPLLPELHNQNAGWQGAFRVGHPDAVLWRYALRVCGGADGLVLTHCDRHESLERIATSYKSARNDELFDHDERGAVVDLKAGDLEHQERLGRALRGVTVQYEKLPTHPNARIEFFEAALGVPVVMISAGPAARHKSWRK